MADIGAGPLPGALQYNNTWPSPTLRMQRGAPVDITLVNDLSEATNVHWHGLSVPWEVDGHPTVVVAPGASKRHQFIVANRAGTYWYHPHPDGATARQAYLGLGGLLIVDDGNDSARGLPTGSSDVLLVLADKRLGGLSQLNYAPTATDLSEGLIGDTLLCNGKQGFHAPVEPVWTRLRLLNASNARILNPAFADGRTVWLIGTDGGLMDAPVALTSVMLSPGERVELLVDLAHDAGQQLRIVSQPFALGMMPGAGSAQTATLDLLFLDVAQAATGPSGALPTTFEPIVRYEAVAAVTERRFQLTSGMGMGMGTTASAPQINGLSYDPNRVDFQVPIASLERWVFINMSQMPHPMHIHATQFQVLTRGGAAAGRVPTDFGWKDTVLLGPLETVEIAVRFDSNPGRYVLHCHNLEHEDGGMMSSFDVI
jgi:FtsP/CotA-like multicopper oxidase with cupredoxin domain